MHLRAYYKFAGDACVKHVHVMYSTRKRFLTDPQLLDRIHSKHGATLAAVNCISEVFSSLLQAYLLSTMSMAAVLSSVACNILLVIVPKRYTSKPRHGVVTKSKFNVLRFRFTVKIHPICCCQPTSSRSPVSTFNRL